MSLRHEITFRCDVCDTNFMIDEETMELPPGWLGLQVVIADTDGCVPDHEREVYGHFCSQTCLIEFAGSTELRRRLCLVQEEMDTAAAKEEDDGNEDGNEDEPAE